MEEIQVSCSIKQWSIQDLSRAVKGDHGERVERKPKWGFGGGAPGGV